MADPGFMDRGADILLPPPAPPLLLSSLLLPLIPLLFFLDVQARREGWRTPSPHARSAPVDHKEHGCAASFCAMAVLLAVAIWLVLATTSVAAHMEVARAAHGRVARSPAPRDGRRGRELLYGRRGRGILHARGRRRPPPSRWQKLEPASAGGARPRPPRACSRLPRANALLPREPALADGVRPRPPRACSRPPRASALPPRANTRSRPSRYAGTVRPLPPLATG